MQTMHKALRTTDIVELILSHLDTKSLCNSSLSCKTWHRIITEASLWRKLARKIANSSKQSFYILTQKGINQTFEDLGEESKHFRQLCLRYRNFTTNWRSIQPSETVLKCSPAEVCIGLVTCLEPRTNQLTPQVNKRFNFSWEPWWWWKDKRGWIAAFAVDGDFLLCGVIETLQVKDGP